MDERKGNVQVFGTRGMKCSGNQLRNQRATSCYYGALILISDQTRQAHDVIHSYLTRIHRLYHINPSDCVADDRSVSTTFLTSHLIGMATGFCSHEWHHSSAVRVYEVAFETD